MLHQQYSSVPGISRYLPLLEMSPGQDVMSGPTMGVLSTYGGARCKIIFLTLTRLITPSLAHDTSGRIQIDDLQLTSNF